ADEVDEELAEEVGDMSVENQGVVVPVINTENATAHGTIRILQSRSPAGALAPQTQGQGQQSGLLAPPIYPSNSVRLGANDDLNRFVSSSTATSGTTLTAGSAGSFVKHAGPGHVVGNGYGNGNMRRIR